MLNFILGRSGSGKSQYIMDKMNAVLEQTSHRVVLLVPEQFSFETERQVYRQFTGDRIRRIEVVSFMRLANSVFRTYGGLAGTYADASDKTILMNLALGELKDCLHIYGRSSGSSLTKCMLEAVEECKTWGISPDRLDAVGEQLEDGRLKDKLKELSVIYSAYDAFIGRLYLDASDDITRAGELLKQHPYFSDTVVFIDEFDGFTANENAVLKAVLAQSADVYLSLCLPSAGVSAESGLFAPVKRTFQKMLRFAKECGVGVASPVVLEPGKRFLAPELAHLEQNILAEHIEPFPGECRNLRIQSAANEFDEVDYVLAAVKKLVREEGYRYRDIVITARDLSVYQDALYSGFAHYNIPYFMDMLSPVTEKPLIRFVGSLLRAAAGGTQAVMDMLKCDVLGYSVEEVSAFENYIYTWNISGSGLKQAFTAHPRGFVEQFSEEDEALLALVNRIREEAVGMAETLASCGEAGDGAALSRVIYELLERQQIKERIQAAAEDFLRIGQERLANECVRVWEILMEILDSLAAALKGTSVSLKRYLELYQLVAANYETGEIPQQLDAVTVGSSERIRTAGPRAVFVLGVNDGAFPYVPPQSGLLTDSEKEQLAGFDLQMSRSLEEMILQERFLAYKALTVASERLMLSYRRCSLEGKPLAPSFLIDQLLLMFGEGCKRSDEDVPPLDTCQTGQTAFSCLARHFREDTPLRQTLEAYLNGSGYVSRIGKLYQLLRDEKFRLNDPEIAAELFGRELRLSASRFERFQSCKFLYFCNDGLQAKPRKKAELNPLETGVLIHDIIYRLLTGDKPLRDLSDAALKVVIREELDNYIETKMGGKAGKSPRFLYLYQRLGRTLFQILSHLREEMDQSGFVPSDFELQIGRGGPVDALRVLAPDGTVVRVEGRIDRVDTFEKDGKKYVRVIDYKTGTRDFKLSDVFYGLNMQMLIYLFSIWETRSGKYQGSLPAGVLYMPAKRLDASLSREAGEDEIAGQARKAYRMDGLILDDEVVIEAMDREVSGVFIPVKRLAKEKTEEIDGQTLTVKFDKASKIASLSELGRLKQYTEKLLGDMAQELHRGEIEAVPLSGDRTPCSYCDYRTVCGHQEDGDCRVMEKLKDKKSVMDKIGEVLADE